MESGAFETTSELCEIFVVIGADDITLCKYPSELILFSEGNT